MSICMFSFLIFLNLLMLYYFYIPHRKKYVGQNHVIIGTMSDTPNPMILGSSGVSLSQQLYLVLVVDNYGW